MGRLRLNSTPEEDRAWGHGDVLSRVLPSVHPTISGWFADHSELQRESRGHAALLPGTQYITGLPVEMRLR